MPFSERQNWVQYARHNGPLNHSLRIDAAIGRAVLPFLKKGTRLKDLMPWPRDNESGDVGQALEAVAMALKAAHHAGGGQGKKVRYKVRKRKDG